VTDAVPAVSTRTRAALFLILAAGFLLRVWTVGSGVPHTVEDDEPVIMEKALHMMQSGDLNPHFFDYGGFTIYLHLAVASLRFLVGAMSRDWAALDKVWEGDFYLWTRMTSVVFGTLTIYLVYRIGFRWNVMVGLVGALFVAIHPHLVRSSHFALTDTPLTFLTTLAMLLSLVAAEDRRLRWFLIAGSVAGLAAATKYSGALTVLMPMSAALLAPEIRYRSAAVLTASAGLVIGYFLAAPYSLLDLTVFLNSFASLAQHYNAPRPAAGVATDYMKYMRNALSLSWGGWWNTLGWPALLFAMAGLGRLALQMRSRTKRTAAAVVLVFAFAYFWLIIHQSLVFARYAMPIIPALCLGIALTLDLIRRFWGLSRGVLVLTALLALQPAVQAFAADWDRRRTSTEEVTARWIETNVSDQDSIVIESPRLRLRPRRGKVEYVTRLISMPLDRYRADGVAYLVTSSAMEDVFFNNPEAHAPQVAAYRQLFGATQMVYVIRASADHPGPMLMVLKVPR